jgi:hypothetical protein
MDIQADNSVSDLSLGPPSAELECLFAFVSASALAFNWCKGSCIQQLSDKLGIPADLMRTVDPNICLSIGPEAVEDMFVFSEFPSPGFYFIRLG